MKKSKDGIAKLCEQVKVRVDNGEPCNPVMSELGVTSSTYYKWKRNNYAKSHVSFPLPTEDNQEFTIKGSPEAIARFISSLRGNQ